MHKLMLILSLVAACKRNSPAEAAKHLGPDALCAWLDSSAQVVCIYAGQRYVCMVGATVQCAVVNKVTPEG